MLNNVGIIYETLFVKMTEGERNKMTSGSLKYIFVNTQASVEVIQEWGEECVINFFSVAGIRGESTSTAYCTLKHGIQMLNCPLAAELRTSDIRLNAIHPSYIGTVILYLPNSAPTLRRR